jgi:cyclopropane fatty-acyl-phospholipid synthase-like methyltransferase
MDQKELLAFDYEYDAYTTQELIDEASTLPIHQFDQDIPPGKVLDVGYGMGALVLYYASQGREVHALDYYPHVEIMLRKRLAIEPYRDVVSFSLSSMPDGILPQEEFAIISVCNLLHFFDFGTAQIIVDRLSQILISGGWLITKNHHKSHLYSNNPAILGPEQRYKHFFSKDEMERLFFKKVFAEKYIEVQNHCPSEKERTISEYYWSLSPEYTRKWLKQKYIDIDYHTDITTVHQKALSIQK